MSSACRPYSSSELTCSICEDYLTDPVTIACGHSFCAPCLCLLWEDTQAPTCCPVCKAVSLPMEFKSAILAKKKVLPAGQSVCFQSPSSAEQICNTHQLLKVFFCPVDKIPLCLLCCYSRDHVTHTHHPVKQAADHHRDALDLRMEMIRAEYPKVCRYLHEEMKSHLERLANEGKMLFQQLRRNRSSMVHTGKVLRRIYGELKELCCKADVDLLQTPQDGHVVLKTKQGFLSFCLQDSGEIVIRSQLVKLYMPKPVDPQLTAWTITGMLERLINFRGLCKESWAHRKDMRLSSEGIFLLLCVKADAHFSLFSTSPLIRQYIQRPQGWVGVFLDYECGIVSFVDVAKSSLICNFLSCSFSFPLRPFICYGPK
ncbi:tripartite motif-containing protein 77-like [Glossophaga mutica]